MNGIDIVSYVLASLLVICVLVILAIIIYHLFQLCDYAFRDLHEGHAVITQKEFIPQHTESRSYYNVALKMPMIEIVTVDDEYIIYLKDNLNKISEHLDVTKSKYGNLKEGDTTKTSYKIGRITRKVKIVDVNS